MKAWPHTHRSSVWLLALAAAAVLTGCLSPTRAQEVEEGTVICKPLTDGGAGIEVMLERPGRLSAAVYTTDGRLVRELLRGQEVKAGQQSLRWDGLDQQGQPLPAADEYEVRLLLTPGFRAEYVTSVGIRPDSAPYDSWVGNHGGPAAIALDETGLYASATVTETAPVLLKQSLDGRTRHWTRGRGAVTRGRFQGGAALAGNGDGRLYMLQQNGYLQVIDSKAGRRLQTWDVMPPDYQRNREERNQTYHHGGSVAGADLAASGETLVLSQRDRNLLTWLDPASGESVATVALPSPAGITARPNGTVYAISGEQVLEVSPEGVQRTVIGDGLDTPARLAFSPTDKTLLIAEWGERHQVRRFDLQGKLLATYGREGGRLQGAYKPEDFLQVSSIAADTRGGFVISEQSPAPRRIAHFDRNGKLIDEWYGGQPYYAWGAPDPRRPTRVWFNPGAWLTLAEIDPETRSWRVLENYHQPSLGGGLIGTVTSHRGRWRVLYHDDRRYLVSESSPQVLRHIDGALQAVSVVSDDGKDLAEATRIAGYEGKAQAFRWLDHNGDGEPQADELEFAESRRVPNGRRGVADNFELLTVSSGRDDDGRAFIRVHRTAPTWTERGPVYPFGEEPGINEIAGDATIHSPAGTGGTRGVGAYRDTQGNYYVHYNTGTDWHGASWPTYWGGRSRLLKWNPEGTEIWQVGRHAIHGGLGGRPHTTPPGFIHVGAAIIGEVRDTVVMADRVEWMGMVWTKDGLYVGNVLDDRVDDGLPEEVYYWWRTPDGDEAIVTSDNATGGAIVEADDGSVWFFTQGRNSVPTYRIHGWDGWQRFTGRVTLADTPAHAAAQGHGLTGEYQRINKPSVAGLLPDPYAPVTLRGEAAAAQVDARIWHGSPRRRPGNDTVIDGFQHGPLVDWSRGIPPLGEAGNVGRRGTFAVRWTGTIEAPLSEAFAFSVYSRGGVRLWIDGTQHIFGWNESNERRESRPIQLEAGRRYPVQLDFYSTHMHPACSLNWESFSRDRERIPSRYLYPEMPIDPSEQPDPRLASRSIRADTFDVANIAPDDRRNYTYGLRHRGIGKPGAWLGYRRIDLGDGADRLVPHASGTPAGKGTFDVVLTFHLDSPEAPAIAELRLNRDRSVPEDGIPLAQTVSGVHDIYVLNATDGGWHFLRLHSFTFRQTR